MPLLRVKVSDGNLRKEVEGKLKNPGEILWVSFGLLTRDIFGTSFLLTFKTSAVSIDTAMVLCWPIDKLCVRKLWWRSLLSSRKSSDSSSFWLFKAFQSGQKETFQKVSNSFGGRWHWLSSQSGRETSFINAVTSHPHRSVIFFITYYPLPSLDNMRLWETDKA